mmetsp:Transcript_2143/g.3265  ORF Transcript_2143/g.3265 Transcript_2143/m.3265 type:complete len:324 (-) Transcript_2143:994-1965(-)|eukprot:CAMPEP_0184672840 /NCGR_PEP_ID=MMETSP0308-20130426/86336_1 /TAXON_ID=38269 /ORGANISM="Gloeochaete witrockiana, Strain SAG 46.84" /LENGTH=323 /DNA_ID=CAMNT_0027120235 /DNA_START=201 /DNA_END=1172 /DNA_ORIENTATION=+
MKARKTPSTSASNSKKGILSVSSGVGAAALQAHILQKFSINHETTKREKKFVQGEKDLSLAERYGYVPKRPMAMTNDQWTNARETAQHRNQTLCPICKDELKDENQILLSCSHVFHRTCLTSYEKFAQCSACPVCRLAHYQKKALDRNELLRHQMIMKIQAVYRSFVCVMRLHAMLKKGGSSGHRSRNWVAREVSVISDQIVRTVEKNNTEVDAFLAQIDASVAQARRAFKAVSLRVDWPVILNKAKERSQNECPICLGALSLDALKKGKETKVEILSCTHAFHTTCITSFEMFGHAGADENMCPVCRSCYTRQSLESLFSSP